MGCDISDLNVGVAEYNKCLFSIKNDPEKLLFVFPYRKNKLLSCSSISYKLLNIEKKVEEEKTSFKEKNIFT